MSTTPATADDIMRAIGIRATAASRETWPTWGWGITMTSTGASHEDRIRLVKAAADQVGIEESDELTFTTRTAELLDREIVLVELNLKRRIPPLFDDWRRELVGEDA